MTAGLSDINAELHNACMLQQKCKKQLFLRYRYRAAKLLSER